MNARQWLGRARHIDKEISTLEIALQNARDQATKITQNYESDGAQSTKDPHKLDMLAEYVYSIEQKKEELINAKKEITDVIYKLKDGRQRAALIGYYVNGMTWEEVAAQMHYSWRATMYIRKMALLEIEKVCIDLHTPFVV